MGFDNIRRHATVGVRHGMVLEDDEMWAMLTVAGFIEVLIETRPDSHLACMQKTGWEE